MKPRLVESTVCGGQANYLSAGQIYLMANPLLPEPLVSFSTTWTDYIS